MKTKNQFKWRYLLVGVIVVAGCVAIYLVLQWRAAQPVYDYLQVGRGEMTVTLRESGVIEPEHRLSITPPISGRVDTIEVLNGAEVKQGQVLALMSSTDRAALIDAARATHDGGKEYRFWEQVYKPAPLLAPLDGRIIAIDVVPGEVVVAAQAVFVMSDHLIAQANVDETDLEHIWVGQKCNISLEGFPDATLTGTVNQIAYDATTVNNVTTYLVNIFLDKTPKFVVSGLSADIFFGVSDRKNVLRIPTDAITPDGQVLVVPAPDTAPVLRDIQVGATDGTYTEVISGLHEGDWIARQQFALQKVSNTGFSFTPGRQPHRH
jgi:macrolide-specific efflux system membrane fusion protein